MLAPRPAVLRFLGLAIVSISLGFLAAMPRLQGEPTRAIVVRWPDKMLQGDREMLEERHGLHRQSNQGMTFLYDLLDETPRNIEALIREPMVEATEHINRTTFALDPTAPPGLIRTGLAWRSGLQDYLPFISPLAAAMVVIGLALVVGVQRVGRWLTLGIIAGRRIGSAAARSRVRRLVVEAAVLSCASLALSAFVYPDLLIHHSVRLTGTHDLVIPFHAAFLHARYFLTGAVDIWNPFDQVNDAYLQMTTGFHTPFAVIEGGLYALLYPLFDRPGEAFFNYYSTIHPFLMVVVRTIGGLALASLYTDKKAVRAVAIILLNTTLSNHVWSGLLFEVAFSFIPLLLFFFAVLLRQRTAAATVWMIAAFGVVFSTMPLIALGYFYVPLHFVLVAGLVLVLFDRWQSGGWRGITNQAFWGLPGPWSRLRLVGLLAAVAWIIATAALYLGLIQTTFSLSGGEVRTSLSNMFRPSVYYAQAGSGIGSDVVLDLLNFNRNVFDSRGTYIGALSLGLAAIGAVFSRLREKWIYVAGVAGTFFIGYPAQVWTIGSPAHAVIAWTNPFAYLLAHLHGSLSAGYYYLLPLVVLGLMELFGPARTAVAGAVRAPWVRTALVAAMLLTLVRYRTPLLPGPSWRLADATFLFLMVLLSLRLFVATVSWRWLSQAGIAALVVAELFASARYLGDIPFSGDRLYERRFTGLERFGDVFIDYQNPGFWRFPRHVYTDPKPVTPITQSSPHSMLQGEIYFLDQTAMGAYYQTTMLTRIFDLRGIYQLRHMAYDRAGERPALKEYMTRNRRYISHASVGVDVRRNSLEDIVAAGADGYAVLLRDASGAAIPQLGGVLSPPPSDAIVPAAAPPLRFELAPVDRGRRQRAGFIVYDVPLPSGFPAHTATTLFGDDARAIRLIVDEVAAVPAQGSLIRPYTFDVNNVRGGYLTLAVPGDKPVQRMLLEVDQDPLIRNVRQYRGDTISIDYAAPSDGWMVIKNPYEDGWQATVNGRPVPVYIANDTIMAIPVPRGLSEVTVQYKPGWTAHRVLVNGHVVLAPLLLLAVLAAALFQAATWLPRGSGAPSLNGILPPQASRPRD